MIHKHESYNFVVCGGGLAGVCAAVAAARQGLTVCLIHDRPVVGGNSSSEVRVTPHGAARFHGYARETGIISELLIEELARNHELMTNGGHNAVWDQVLYDLIVSTPRLTLYLNTSVISVDMTDANDIESVIARVGSAETELTITGALFADCTGDGIVAYLAGCECRFGTESYEEFSEPHAPQYSSHSVMGSSLLFRAVDVGHSVPFRAPGWAHQYNDPTVFYEHGRKIDNLKHGYWWFSIGVPWNTIHDNEAIRHELTRHVLGVWDWIKNKDPLLMKQAENLAIDWIGQIPGKRESRRIMGMYLMTEHDAFDDSVVADEVAYGGWFVDLHSPLGLLDTGAPEMTYPHLQGGSNLICGPYGISMRILIAKDVGNLLMAGRNVSATHVALGTLRVQQTTGLLGQAIGTMACVALGKKVPLHQLPSTRDAVTAVQQALLRDGCFLLNVRNEDSEDLARKATVTVSSEALLYGRGPFGTQVLYDLTTFSREKKVDPDESVPDEEDRLLRRRGQWIDANSNRINSISVCLTNWSSTVQSVHVSLVSVEHIWDYRLEGVTELSSTDLRVPVGSFHWVEWAVNLELDHQSTTARYVRLDLFPNPEVSWHCASEIEPGHLSAFDIGRQMRRYKYGRTLSFKISPPQPCFGPENVINGVTRPYRASNLWRSDPNQPFPQWVQLTWGVEHTVSQLQVTFEGQLFREFEHAGEAPLFRDPQTVKDYRIHYIQGGEWTELMTIRDNYQRQRNHKFPKPITTSSIRLEILSTNGDSVASVYEVRCYGPET